MNIRAKYSAKCRCCRVQVRAGQLCNYEPYAARGQKITCTTCAAIEAVTILPPERFRTQGLKPPPLPPVRVPAVTVSTLRKLPDPPALRSVVPRHTPSVARRRGRKTNEGSGFTLAAAIFGVFILCLLVSAGGTKRTVYHDVPATSSVAAFKRESSVPAARSVRSSSSTLNVLRPPAPLPVSFQVSSPSPSTDSRTLYQPAPKAPTPTTALRPAPPAYKPHVAENGSYYGQPNDYGVPKTVHVSGYYRKDGTYVRGHYRSKPSRR